MYIDSAKTSTLEGAATTVYATGGRGNTRLITWEGEKTLTFTVEDALLSPLGFSILSGAGLFKDSAKYAHVHQTVEASVAGSEADGYYIDLTDALKYLDNSGNDASNVIDAEAPLFITKMEDGSVAGLFDVNTTKTKIEDGLGGAKVIQATDGKTIIYITQRSGAGAAGVPAKDDTVIVDFYIIKEEAKAMELQIDAEHFAGYYYVEADTLVRKQSDGRDCPAILTLPLVKIQSNFSIAMASSGDPSTFTFTMDAMPGYTYFDRQKKVLCVLQIVDESAASAGDRAVMRHGEGYVHGHEGMVPEDQKENGNGYDSFFNP